jgi:hypothetical protein
MPPCRYPADTRVHQRWNRSIGRVPVAPRSNRILFDGARKRSGFAEVESTELLRKTEMIKKTAFTIMIDLIMLYASKARKFSTVVFHHDPGREIPQYGQSGSSMLMSFLQLGQRIERRAEVFIAGKGKAGVKSII